MIKYINAELSRILHKRSTYIYFGLLILFFLGVTLFFGNINAGSELLNFGYQLIPIVAVFVTAQVFITVYCDDVSSKTYANTISTGISRLTIVLSKLLLFVINTILILIPLALVFFGLYFMYGGRFSPADMHIVNGLAIYGLSTLFAATGYASIAAIVVFGLQSNVAGITLFILIFLELINSLIGMLAQAVPYMDIIAHHTITSMLARTLENSSQTGLALDPVYYGAIILYLTATSIISAILFNRKDISV